MSWSRSTKVKDKIKCQKKLEKQSSRMFLVPDNYKYLSQKLSEVLNDSGVNESEMLKNWMLNRNRELTYDHVFQGSGLKYARRVDCFQSVLLPRNIVRCLQTEMELMICVHGFHIVDEQCDYRPGRLNVKVIQNESTPSGFCFLEVVPLDTRFHDGFRYIATDKTGKQLLKNTVFDKVIPVRIPSLGPATNTNIQQAYAIENEYPQGASQPKLLRQGFGSWTTDEIRRNTDTSRCFIIATGNNSNENSELEWRISSTAAYQHLTTFFNMTQIRCYILLKIFLKMYLNQETYLVISNYLTKTAIFYCIENDIINDWEENNLFHCLTTCLFAIKHFLISKNCPDFFIPEKNFHLKKMTIQDRHHLFEVINYLQQGERLIQMLLNIKIAKIGQKLCKKLINQGSDLLDKIVVIVEPRKSLCETTASWYRQVLGTVLYSNTNAVVDTFVESMNILVSKYRDGDKWDKAISSLLAPRFCTSLGSVIASRDISANGHISSEAYHWLSIGFNSDVSSGRLKLASALFCAGATEQSEIILRDTESQYIQSNAVPVCFCSDDKNSRRLPTRTRTSYCIQFIQCEKNSVPKELQYEMFRSTRDDMLFRNEADYWMDCAVVDSLPYLYFLQYKVYGCLFKAEEQQQALLKLVHICVDQELAHRETALNLLGQCMEQDNRLDVALGCYSISLKYLRRNNAAAIHLCRLLTLFYDQRITDADPLHTNGATVSPSDREQGLSSLAGDQRCVQNESELRRSNLFKKDFENTLAEKLVDDMSVKMKSVGAIYHDGVRGTVFRVGSKYVMTALHVVTGITNPTKRQNIPDNNWSKLEEPTVWVTFAASAMDLQRSIFYLKQDVIFMSKRLDIAVLELKPGNILPRKLKLSKDMGEIEQVNLIGFGHPSDPRKQLDANCKVVAVTDQLIQRIQTENENILQRYSLRTVMQMHGLNPNILTGSYTELLDRERFVCHAAMEHGASGAPAIAENEVVGIFVKGIPSFFYELRSRPCTAQYVQHFPNQLRFEMCSKMDYIYRIMRHTNPMLAEDLFD